MSIAVVIFAAVLKKGAMSHHECDDPKYQMSENVWQLKIRINVTFCANNF